MARRRSINVLQVLGGIVLAATATLPGLFVAGHPRTPVLAMLCMLFAAAAGGLLAGALIAPSHRIAGAIGGMIAGPLALLAVTFYFRGRGSAFRAEVVLVSLIASLPGLGVYFLLQLLTDVLFPRKRRSDFDDEDFDDDDYDDFDEDDRPRRRRSRRDEPYDENCDDDQPRRRRSRRDDLDDDDYDDDRPRRRRPRDDYDD
jgi:Na+/proline symporter